MAVKIEAVGDKRDFHVNGQLYSGVVLIDVQTLIEKDGVCQVQKPGTDGQLYYDYVKLMLIWLSNQQRVLAIDKAGAAEQSHCLSPNKPKGSSETHVPTFICSGLQFTFDDS